MLFVKFLLVWWYNYNKKYHMVLVIHFLLYKLTFGKSSET